MPPSNLILVPHPIVQTNLAELRAVRLTTAASELLEGPRRADGVRGHAIPTRPQQVQTPLEMTSGTSLARPVTVVPILRAGLPMAAGVHRVFPDARLGISVPLSR